MSFALSSLASIIEEQLEALGDDKLALVISRFSRFLSVQKCGRRAKGHTTSQNDLEICLASITGLVDPVNPEGLPVNLTCN